MTPNAVDGLYRNIKHFLHFLKQGFYCQSMTMKETLSTLHVCNLLFHQCRKPIFISQLGLSAICAQRDNTLNIQFMFFKEVFHKLKHFFSFGACFPFFADKEVLFYGTITDIPY